MLRPVVVVLALVALTASSPAQQPTRVQARIDAILEGHASDPAAARAAVDGLFDTLIAHAPARDAGWREAAAWRRLLGVVGGAPEGERAGLLAALRGAPAFAQTLAFALREGDEPAKVGALAARLARERGEHLEKFATLAAAVCVVHDEPLVHRINENSARAADPVAIFDFFRTTEGATLLGVRKMPAELLIHVVDATASIEELAWAQARYRGDRAVGRRFFDIRYDEDHFYKETPKKVTEAGFSLRNILAHGGVCADQAYFASHAARAIGVPAAYVRGRDASGSHAWVGYLQSKGKSVEWNFDTGRYDSYQVVRGTIEDPQTRRRVPDSYLGLAARAMTDPAAERFQAIALTDGALRLAAIRAGAVKTAFPPATPDAAVTASGRARDASARTQLELLDAALRLTPSSVGAWLAVRDMAAAGDLSAAELRSWSGTLFSLCGEEYPEFSLDILAPMISSVKSAREQDALWNSAFKNYAQHPDLAAQVRFLQGRMWERERDEERAWSCYQDVITRYPNSSSSVVDAAGACKGLLEKTGKTASLVPMLEAAWRKTQRPTVTGPSFILQSNWFRLGRAYAEALEAAGKAGEARKVRTTLGLR